MENTSFKPFVIAKEPKGKLRTMVVNGEVYYSLLDIGHAIGIGNPHETKRYLDDKEIYRGNLKTSPSFISVKNVLRMLFYAKNKVLGDFVPWLINVLLPYEVRNRTIIINEDEVIASKQATPEYINEDDDLDDDSYPILNKELRKQIFIFERELLKVEQLFMDIGDLLDSANEIINPESIKKTSVNQ